MPTPNGPGISKPLFSSNSTETREWKIKNGKGTVKGKLGSQTNLFTYLVIKYLFICFITQVNEAYTNQFTSSAE